MEISEITIELMFDRIKSLENQVNDLQSQIIELKDKLSSCDTEKNMHTSFESTSIMSMATPITGKRDTTKYMWAGNVYLKNRLVLAIVRDYTEKHPGITRLQLKTVFAKTLQGSIGVVENAEIAQQRSDYQKRFFAKPAETINLVDGNIYVCTQWGLPNITNFITRAKALGYNIIELK